MMQDKDILKGLEQVLDTLEVRSLVGGDMLVKITYQGGQVPGFHERIHIASEIAELLHRRIGRIRGARRSPPQQEKDGA